MENGRDGLVFRNHLVMVHVIRPRPFIVMWERNALPYGVVVQMLACGAPRSAHLTVYRNAYCMHVKPFANA